MPAASDELIKSEKREAFTATRKRQSSMLAPPGAAPTNKVENLSPIERKTHCHLNDGRPLRFGQLRSSDQDI